MEHDLEIDEFNSDIEAAAEQALASLLPKASKEKYEKAYDNFKAWCAETNCHKINEKVLLAYFSTKLETFKPSTTWTFYSMIKSTLSVKDNLDISGYCNLKTLLKRKSEGYIAKKSKIFTKEDIYNFVKSAPDEFLVMKVVCIIGLYGACRREELVNMDVVDLEYLDHGIRITIPKTKTKIVRQFVIDEGEDPNINFISIVKRYANLRPTGVVKPRFFVGFRNGKCTRQVVGINTIGAYPKKIANFLNLPSPEKYTGHCFRRTSTSLLADTGVNITVIKQHGGWLSDRVAEGYVENSLNNKRKIAGRILGKKTVKIDENGSASTSTQVSSISVNIAENGSASTSTEVSSIFEMHESENAGRQLVKNLPSEIPVGAKNAFTNLHNCTFNFDSKEK